MKSQPVAATREYVNQVIATMQDLPDSLDWNVIDQVLKLIHDCKQVVFFGTQFSNSAAMHFQTDLLMLGKFTTAYMDTERQLECAMNMTKDSVAIVVSVNGNFMGTASKMMKYLKKSKCKVVLITSEERNFLNIPIDYRIKLSMPKDGKSGTHALLTTVELMSLRYYTLYSPSEKNKR